MTDSIVLEFEWEIKFKYFWEIRATESDYHNERSNVTRSIYEFVDVEQRVA